MTFIVQNSNGFIQKNRLKMKNESSSILNRVLSVWLFNREGSQRIPYRSELTLEALLLYASPAIVWGALLIFFKWPKIIEEATPALISIGISLILEIVSILLFLGGVFVSMAILLPGFPKSSHATPKMVFIAFSYVFSVKIVESLLFGLYFILVTGPTPPLEFLQFLEFSFQFYFVVVLAFSIRSYTGRGIIASLACAFAIFLIRIPKAF